MRAPREVFDSIKRMYQLYYETPYALRDEGISQERRKILETEGTIWREPFIEVSQPFVLSGRTTGEASEELGFDPVVGQFLGSGLMEPDLQLYQHQWEAFAAAASGMNVVVTSGTGSGKTECFLLPVLASLVQESLSWGPDPELPDGPFPRRDNLPLDIFPLLVAAAATSTGNSHSGLTHLSSDEGGSHADTGRE